jgi:UDP-2,4-diacetamido-2,4,6-trideoxy-beta-L-altropyranose hydrolase
VRFLIRCDSSIQIGSGHLSRCLILAKLLKKANHDVALVCRELKGNLVDLAKAQNVQVFTLDAPSYDGDTDNIPYGEWLEVPLEQEISDFSKLVDSYQPDWVIADHYALDTHWETSIQTKALKLMVIDDIFRKHSCDLFLDQNFNLQHDQKTKKLVPQECKRLLGPEYALLQEDFLKNPVDKKNIQDFPKNVLIFFGGSDPANATLRFLKIIPKILDMGQKYKIVVGRSNPKLDEIQSEAKKLKSVEILVQVSNMAQLMLEADFFIGASGTITWERCFLGLPAICLAVAENQVEIGENLHTIQVHEYLGMANNVSENHYIKTINDLFKDVKKRTLFSENSIKLGVSKKTLEILKYLI